MSGLIYLKLQAPPPTANRLRGYDGKRCYRPKKYQAWLDASAGEIVHQRSMAPFKTVEENFQAILLISKKTRGDLDNRTKGFFDLLQYAGVIKNDSLLNGYAVFRSKNEGASIIIFPGGIPLFNETDWESMRSDGALVQTA